MPQVRADRDLGSGARSMVETDQVKNGQSAAFLDVLPGPRSEYDHYLTGVNRASTDRRAIPEPLDIKPRRHDVPTPDRYPSLA